MVKDDVREVDNFSLAIVRVLRNCISYDGSLRTGGAARSECCHKGHESDNE